MKGLFIVFEGIEGSGKTTHINALKEWLETDHKVEVIKEPTDRDIGSLIRKVLYKKIEIAEETLPLLFAADRADNTIRVIIPALKRGTIVICDRYVFSSLAYQGGGMNVKFDIKWLKWINRYAIEPDIVFFLDIPPEEGLKKKSPILDHNYFHDLERQKNIRETYYKVLNLNWAISDLDQFKKRSIDRKLVSKVNTSMVGNTLVVRIDSMLPFKENHKIIKDFVSKLIKPENIKEKGEKVKPKPFSYIKS